MNKANPIQSPQKPPIDYKTRCSSRSKSPNNRIGAVYAAQPYTTKNNQRGASPSDLPKGAKSTPRETEKGNQPSISSKVKMVNQQLPIKINLSSNHPEEAKQGAKGRYATPNQNQPHLTDLDDSALLFFSSVSKNCNFHFHSFFTNSFFSVPSPNLS